MIDLLKLAFNGKVNCDFRIEGFNGEPEQEDYRKN